jgi:hypothetical protein
LFIKAFAAEAFDKSNKDANLDYNKVATLVSKEEKFEFLSGNIFKRLPCSS